MFNRDFGMRRFLQSVGFVAGMSSIAWAGTMGNMTKLKQIDGFFIGAYAGGAWNQNTSFQSTVLEQPANPYFTTPSIVNQVQDTGSQGMNFAIPVGGGQVGYQKRQENTVYGLVADYGVFNLSPSVINNNVQYVNYASTYSLSTQLNAAWLFTTRGKIGYVWEDSWPLIYGFAGLAVSNIQVSNQFSDNTAALAVGNSITQKTVAGWTVGGGFDYSLSERLFMNVEYLYVNLPTTSTTAYVSTTNTAFYALSPYQTSVQLTANIIRAGINYKIG